MNGQSYRSSVLVLGSAAFTRPVLLDIVQASGHAPIVIHDESLYSRPSQDVGRNDVVLDFLEPGIVWSDHKRHLADVMDNVPKMFERVGHVVAEYHPIATLLADDTGVLEAVLMSMSVQLGVPVIVAVHGDPWPSFRRALSERHRARTREYAVSTPRYFSNPATIRREVAYTVAVPSKSVAVKYFLAGVHPRRIALTGWPHFERVMQRNANELVVTKCLSASGKRTPLVASSGSGMFEPGSKRDMLFWRDASHVVSKMHANQEVRLRLKAGDADRLSCGTKVVRCECADGPAAIISHAPVFTDSRTMAFEAALRGTPVYGLGRANWWWGLLLIRRGVRAVDKPCYRDGRWNTHVRRVLAMRGEVRLSFGSTNRIAELIRAGFRLPDAEIGR